MASETLMPSQNTRDAAPPTETEQQRIQASPSSAAGPPTAIDTSLQQAFIPSGDGNGVRADQIKKPSEVNRDDPNIDVVELPPHSPTFKEQVYGQFP
ncbi:hypothetical protein J3R83DRAFT_12898 [Lanmaoa asiatica]|nr:hypothetical protein J3R83DRAFT_12898 [Lanmaoa asiatica]